MKKTILIFLLCFIGFNSFAKEKKIELSEDITAYYDDSFNIPLDYKDVLNFIKDKVSMSDYQLYRNFEIEKEEFQIRMESIYKFLQESSYIEFYKEKDVTVYFRLVNGNYYLAGFKRTR